MSSPASLPVEIYESAQNGKLQTVVKWLRKGGAVNALSSTLARNNRLTTSALLHAASGFGHLEMVRMLLEQSASIDLQTSFGGTALMAAARYGHTFTLLVLLQHSANPDLQDIGGGTALMRAAFEGKEACVQALLQAKANTELLDNEGWTALRCTELKSHTAIATLIRQHAALPQPVAASHAAPTDAVEPTPQPAPLPVEIYQSAERGELQKVAKWLRKRGPIDAFCSTPTHDGQTSTFALLHTAACNGHLEMVKVLLKRGASVKLPSGLGSTPLMNAVGYGRLSILRILLQHSANPDLQANAGHTALMTAANRGQEACVQALLGAKANTELIDKDGRTALQWAEIRGHTATAELFRQHAAPNDMVPDQYLCPITAEVMIDPVSTVDGFTYERRAIVQWLKTHCTSPVTGVNLESKQLIPCHSLRSLIRDFHEAGAAPQTPGVALPSAKGIGA